MFETFQEAAAEQAKTGAPAADPLAMPIAEARAQQDRYFATLTGTPPPVAAVANVTVRGPHGDVPVRIVRPSTDADLPCIIFLRGAGFWSGGIDSHARTIHTLANLSGCAVCAVDYHRTPEHAFPVQRDDVLAVLQWLREEGPAHGLRHGEPVLLGESAGATIALAAALALRDRRGPLPPGLVLFYNNAGGPKPTARAYSQWVWQRYLGDADPGAVPGPVPMLQDLRGLPPAWLCCGDADPLLSDTLALADKLGQAGVPHELVRFPGMPHAFVMYSATLQPALDALTLAAAAARGFLVPDTTLKGLTA